MSLDRIKKEQCTILVIDISLKHIFPSKQTLINYATAKLSIPENKKPFAFEQKGQQLMHHFFSIFHFLLKRIGNKQKRPHFHCAPVKCKGHFIIL